LVVVVLILLGPIIAFEMVVTVEMLTDLVMKVGASAVLPVAGAALGWGLLRKHGGQARTSSMEV
jgi:hypothetical protein